MLPPLPPAFQALFEAQALIVALDLGKQLKVEVQLSFAGEEQARAGEKAARAGLELGRQALEQPIGEVRQRLASEVGFVEVGGLSYGLGFLRKLQAMLKELPIERQGAVVRSTVTADVNSAELGVLAIAALGAVGTRASATFNEVAKPIPVKPEP